MAEQMKKLNMTAHANTKVKARRAFLETLDWAIEEDKLHPLYPPPQLRPRPPPANPPYRFRPSTSNGRV